MQNVINRDDDLIGSYSDLVEYLKSELLGLLRDGRGAPDSGALANYGEIFDELEKQKDAPGLLVISENNGMGWTVRPYKQN